MRVEAAAPLSTSSQTRRTLFRLAIIVLSGVLLLGAMIFALGSGSQSIPAGDVIRALQDSEAVRRSTWVIVHEVRLPRVLVGAMVGINLAVAGALLQGVVRSPLGDPYILGISAGGGLTAAATTLLITDFPAQSVPIAAFAGSLVGALIVYAVAWDGSGVSTTRLALAGVAFTAMVSALTTTMVVLSVQGGGQIIFQWLVGGLYTASWPEFNLIAPYCLLGLVLAIILARRANILALGDEMAQGLGLNVEATRLMLSAVAAVLAGSSVAVAGMIGFVGLLVPFIARRLVGSDYRFLIPASALLGGTLLTLADTISRVTFPALIGHSNVEFPVGIITAVFGGPLFLWLVRGRRASW